VKDNNAPDNIDVVPDRAEHARRCFAAAPRVRKTHCKNGHPLSGDTIRVGSQGRRICRICVRAYQRARYLTQRNSPSIQAETAE
jgi:hypothetical protein